MAEKAVATFEGAGVFGVEMFLTEDGRSKLNSHINANLLDLSRMVSQEHFLSMRSLLDRTIQVTILSRLANVPNTRIIFEPFSDCP